MHFKLFSSVLCVTLAIASIQNTFANPSPKSECPSVSAIQSVNLDRVTRWDNWTVFTWANKYNTPNYWRFSIGQFHANDETNALAQARKSLTTLTFAEGPSEYRGEWQCHYVTADGYEGVAQLLEDK